MSLSPSDQHTPGSLPSWSLMDFNTPLSCLLHEELQQSPSFLSSKSPSPSPSLNSPHPHLLSSPASMGASTAKVSKRKSRAVNKPPIRVLSADRATFRDMVQKLTGIPTSPSLQSARLWGSNNPSPPALFRPMAARPGSQTDLVAAAHQSMPTLDTSSAYFSRGFSNNNLVYNEVGKSRFNSQYEGNFDPSVRGAMNFDVSGGGGMGNLDSSGGVMYEGGQYNEAMDMERLRRLHRVAELESMFMGSNKLEDLLQSNKLDHWLSPDLIHTPSPQVEIAHSA